MLNRKITQALCKVMITLDHMPPQQMLKRIKRQYENKDKIISQYLNMESTNKQDYFPQSFTQTAINILQRQKILTARFIFACLYFKVSFNDQVCRQVFKDNNQVLNCVEKLNGQYKNRYLSDIGFLNKQNCELRPNHEYSLRNYEYYNSVQEGLTKLHNQRGNYQFLEDRHDYIQWMFPNHYRSSFNSHAEPMGYLEAQIFRTSRKFGLLMLRSIQIFFDFMGIQLREDYTIQIVSEHRLRQCLLVNWHNHLRIRRLLACFSITGFRHIALKLIDFLGNLVYNRKEYERIKRVFKNQWEIYGDNNKQNALYKLCFHPHDDFPAPHSVCQQIFVQTKMTHENYGELKDFDSQQKQQGKMIDENQSNQKQNIQQQISHKLQTTVTKQQYKKVENQNQRKQDIAKQDIEKTNSENQEIHKLVTAATKQTDTNEIKQSEMSIPLTSTPIQEIKTVMLQQDHEQKEQARSQGFMRKLDN